MKNLFKQFYNGLLILFLAHAAIVAAYDKGTAEEATAMVKKAIAFIKENGKEKAFPEFNNSVGQFRERDLYIMVLDANGKMLAHGADRKLIGVDMLNFKDDDGKLFVQELVSTVKDKGN